METGGANCFAYRLETFGKRYMIKKVNSVYDKKVAEFNFK